ncbi:ABC transporter ATP-binding protein [Raoultibacter massiliensis]|uniref:ABC transporter ATP-binding protein n=2 Tax=Raoultibacter massiliensis TaxID=1852371 RepID=UPI000C828AD9|nr:ABC transporter ATP-binding protein [Raoultibacter massiliensis]
MGAIDIEDVCYAYPESETGEFALSDVSLAIASGEFICLIGHSGCGKSTLLSLLAGLSAPSRGFIAIDGAPIEGPSTSRAMVFQHYSLFPWMTAVNNVAFSIRRADRSVSKSDSLKRAHAYLEKVGMDGEAGKYPYQLSGGMQQRVAIARALSMESDILLLDEPFGALDAKNRAELQELLVELWSGVDRKKTVVFVTHDLTEAILLADRIVFMRPGRIEKTIPVDFPRPRDLSGLEHDCCYQALRSELLSLFYLDEEQTDGAGEKGVCDGCR